MIIRCLFCWNETKVECVVPHRIIFKYIVGSWITRNSPVIVPYATIFYSNTICPMNSPFTTIMDGAIHYFVMLATYEETYFSIINSRIAD